MRTLFEAFGTVPVLTFLFLLQLFILRAIITGKIVRIVRLLIITPFLVLIFFFFFASPVKVNRDTEPSEQSRTAEIASSETNIRETDTAAEVTDTVRDGLKPVDEAEFAAVSIENRQNRETFRTASDNLSTLETPKKTSNTTLTPVGELPSAFKAAANSLDTSSGDGSYTGPPKPLVPYPNSRDAVRTADYTTADAQNTSTGLPANFEADAGKIASLQIKPDQMKPGTLELTPEKTNSLMDYFSQSLQRQIEETRPAVVHIEATVMRDDTKKTSIETGGGVIVKTGRGDFYVITNNHVAGNAVSNTEVRIVLHDHRVLHPTGVLPCPEFDLALLPLAEKNLKAAPLGDSDKVKLIDQVFAIGSPFGLEGSISSGIISGLKRRALPIGKKGQFQNFLQTDAAINPGNSGGPLLNTRGQVIGIVTVIATKSGANEGVGLAIPINHVKYVAGRLIRDGVYRRPFIGLDLDRNFDAEQKAALGLQRKALDGSTGEAGEQFIGTRILHVKPDSPAALAGLREGDIIIAFNGNLVEDGDDFNHLIGLSTVDDSPVLDILRGQERLQFAPKLTASR